MNGNPQGAVVISRPLSIRLRSSNSCGGRARRMSGLPLARVRASCRPHMLLSRISGVDRRLRQFVFARDIEGFSSWTYLFRSRSQSPRRTGLLASRSAVISSKGMPAERRLGGERTAVHLLPTSPATMSTNRNGPTLPRLPGQIGDRLQLGRVRPQPTQGLLNGVRRVCRRPLGSARLPRRTDHGNSSSTGLVCSRQWPSNHA